MTTDTRLWPPCLRIEFRGSAQEATPGRAEWETLRKIS